MSYNISDDITYDGTLENWPVTVSFGHIDQKRWDKMFSKPTSSDDTLELVSSHLGRKVYKLKKR